MLFQFGCFQNAGFSPFRFIVQVAGGVLRYCSVIGAPQSLSPRGPMGRRSGFYTRGPASNGFPGQECELVWRVCGQPHADSQEKVPFSWAVPDVAALGLSVPGGCGTSTLEGRRRHGECAYPLSTMTPSSFEFITWVVLYPGVTTALCVFCGSSHSPGKGD